MTTNATDLRVGFLGLGMMGWPMARNLCEAGFDVVVSDVDRDRQARFARESRCHTADSGQSFRDCAVVVAMLPDDRVVREAVIGEGIVSALSEGAVILDMSSSNPTGTLALAEQAASHGVAVVDAPVSGGVIRAADGTLTLMIGGQDEPVERVWPILSTLGGKLIRTGPLGSGHAMKALNNFVGGTTYLLTAEALAIGHEYGLDAGVMIDVMNASTARSFNTEVVFKDHVLTGTYATGFSLGLLAKDVGIAATLADSAGVFAPLCSLSRERWAEAGSGLGGAADHSEAHKRWWPIRLARSGEFEAPADG